MPQTISKSDKSQIIGGAFADRENADAAIQALKDFGVSQNDIQVVAIVNGDQARTACSNAMQGHGLAEGEALFYEKAVQSGKILVAVHSVTDSAPIIEIFDDYQAEYNPDGTRNLRHDVVGMTTGVAAGALAGGIAGTVMGGPVVGAAGAATGAVICGGAGAAVGKIGEHQK